MKKNNLLSFFISRGAVLYTCFSGAYFIISILAQNTKLLEPKQFLSLLLFSYILSVGSTIYRIEGISRIAGRTWHAVFFVGGFIIFLALCRVQFKMIMLATAIFLIVYAPVAIISEVKCSRGTASKEKKTEPQKKAQPEYQSIFSKPDSEKDNRR